MITQISRRFWQRPLIGVLRLIAPSILWKNEEAEEGVVHLTFDDGPSTFTKDILSLLENYGQIGTFFLNGKSTKTYPKSLELLKASSHAIGHHGYDHLNGWKTDCSTYLRDVEKSEALFKSSLFRPPYGKISFEQFRELKSRYKIVMWGIMPGDFDPNISVNECVGLVEKHVKPGSIIVLHDRDELGEKTLEILESLLPILNKKGLQSEALK